MFLFNFLFLGIFTALLFPPFFIFPLGFVIFPLFWKNLLFLNKQNSIKLFFCSGFLYGLGLLTIMLFWIQNPFFIYEETSALFFLSYLLIILLSLIFGLFFILFKFVRNLYYQIYSIPLILILIEIFISNFWYGFPWVSFVLTISNNPFGSILVYLFGPHLSGFLLILFFLLPQIIFIKHKLKNVIIGLYSIILVLIVFLYAYQNLYQSDDFKEISIDIFQMNFSNLTHEYSSNESKYNEIIKLIKNSNAELIIFGENNFPYLVNDLKKIEINQFLNDNQTVIIGGTRKENNKFYNSLFSIQKNSTTYFDKKVLVPFGEFVPFRKYIGFMDFISGSIDFSKGTNERIINTKNEISYIPIICYEIIFFWKLINKENNYSNLLINITNDFWFGDYIGPYQHFYLSKLRAAEFNKNLIRVSNNGISSIIDNNGNILVSSELNKKDKLSYKLLINDEKNLIILHKILGYILTIFCFISLFVLKLKDE